MAATFNIVNAIKKISILLILCTPIFNYQEIVSFFTNTSAESSSLSAVYKVGKDIAFLLIIILDVILIIKTKKISRMFLWFYMVLISLIISSWFFSNSVLLLIIGIRWCLPLFLILPFFVAVDKSYMETISRILYMLLILQVIIQIIEVLIMPPIYGNRYPGFFIYPSGAGLFVNVCFVFCYVFKHNVRMAFILAICSLIIARSATGVAVFAVLCGLILSYRSNKALLMSLMIMPVAGYLLIANLGTLTGRGEDSIAESGGTRVEIFENNIDSFSILPDKFGKATNLAVILEIKDAFIADSTYTSMMVNFGIIGLLIIFAVIVYFLIYAIISKKIDIILFLFVFLLGGISIIIIELFPVNILLPISLAYFIKREVSESNESNVISYNRIL